LKFTWNPAKADTNCQKHGVDFNEATTIFGVLWLKPFLMPITLPEKLV
jgi:uncharacterized DUF497 family protein